MMNAVLALQQLSSVGRPIAIKAVHCADRIWQAC